jgi:hypothetical protein
MIIFDTTVSSDLKRLRSDFKDKLFLKIVTEEYVICQVDRLSKFVCSLPNISRDNGGD